MRQEHTQRLLDDLKLWPEARRTRVSGRGDVAVATRYILSHSMGLTHTVGDGAIAIGNNPVERTMHSDAAHLEVVLPLEPGWAYGGSAFEGAGSDRLVLARGGEPLIGQTEAWNRPDTLARLYIHNAVVGKVRCRIVEVSGLCKRNSGLRRRRWLGQAKAVSQVRLTARAHKKRHNSRLLVPPCD